MALEAALGVSTLGTPLSKQWLPPWFRPLQFGWFSYEDQVVSLGWIVEAGQNPSKTRAPPTYSQLHAHLCLANAALSQDGLLTAA
jgi:hypothetical protein